jgi:rRNA maturation RNase YbeY
VENVELQTVIDAIKVLYPKVKLGKITAEWLSDEQLLEVNRQHLDHDYYTDIITFDYTRGNRISGELLLSIDRVHDNARTQGVSEEQEEARVLAHGVLHLIGYKDKTEEESAEMRFKEDEVLKQMGYGTRS